MARGKDGGGDDWGKFLAVVIGVGVGAIVLYYLQAGREDEDAINPRRFGIPNRSGGEETQR